MVGKARILKIEGNPAVVLIAGFARFLVKQLFLVSSRAISNVREEVVLLTACDIYRPAAIDQLKVLGTQIGVEVYSEPENKDAVKNRESSDWTCKENNHRVVIVDTAGRLAVDEEMMDEIAPPKRKYWSHLRLCLSLTQWRVRMRWILRKHLMIVWIFDGVVLTKLDGDTRGGAALSIRRVVDNQLSSSVQEKRWKPLIAFSRSDSGRIFVKKV